MGVDIGRDEVAAREHYETAKERTLAACVDTEPTALRECVVKAAEAAQSQSEARQDLYAQQDMSKWAFLMMIISGLTFLATLLGIVWIRDTLIETRRAVKAADDAVSVTREIGQTQIRAFVVISEPKFSLFNGNPMFRFVISNTGQSPARSVQIEVDGHVRDGTTFATKARQDNRIGVYWYQAISPRANIERLEQGGLNGDDFANMRAGLIGKPLIVEFDVAAKYVDVFKSPHIDTFRFMSVIPPDRELDGWFDVHAQPAIQRDQ